jgi:hypothetical protein
VFLSFLPVACPYVESVLSAQMAMWNSSNHYRILLLHDLPGLLEDVPLAVRAQMWYMHDGAPAHFSRAMRDVPTTAIFTDEQV